MFDTTNISGTNFQDLYGSIHGSSISSPGWPSCKRPDCCSSMLRKRSWAAKFSSVDLWFDYIYICIYIYMYIYICVYIYICHRPHNSKRKAHDPYWSLAVACCTAVCDSPTASSTLLKWSRQSPPVAPLPSQTPPKWGSHQAFCASVDGHAASVLGLVHLHSPKW